MEKSKVSGLIKGLFGRRSSFQTPEDLEKKEKELQLLKEEIERLQRTSDEEFPFGVLWQDEDDGGLLKIVPMINAVLLIITLVLVIART